MNDTLVLDAIKITIPVLTFILGSLLTIGLKRYEHTREKRIFSVIEILRLSKDWYAQIQNLSAQPSNNQSVIQEKIYEYVSSRLILPDILLHKEIIRKHSSCKILAAEVDAFIEELTNYKYSPLLSFDIHYCIPPSKETSPDLLIKLDIRLQRIAKEAAKILR